MTEQLLALFAKLQEKIEGIEDEALKADLDLQVKDILTCLEVVE